MGANEIHDIFDDFAGSGLVGSGSDLSLGDVVKLGFNEGGVFDSSGFLDFLAEKMPMRTFEELRIPLSIVATDYWTGDVVVLEEGDRLLIDGGTSNPLPFDVSRRHADRVIAVDVTGSRSREKDGEPGWVDLLFKTFEVMQQSIIAARMASQEPALYLKPAIRDVRLLDFNEIEAILEQSRKAADELHDWLKQDASFVAQL